MGVLMNPCVNAALTTLREIICITETASAVRHQKAIPLVGVQSLSQMALLMELSLSQEKWEIQSFLIQMHLGKQADDVRLCEKANKKVNNEEESWIH